MPVKWNLLEHMEATVGCTADFLARNSSRESQTGPVNGTTVAPPLCLDVLQALQAFIPTPVQVGEAPLLFPNR